MKMGDFRGVLVGWARGGLGFVLVLALLLPLAACSQLGTGSLRGSTAHGNLEVSDTQAGEGTGVLAPTVPAKLFGSTETVDDNGVIHGIHPSGIRYTLHGRGTAGLSAEKVSLCAVGDQLATDMSLPIADAYAGERGDGVYDFTPFYREIGPFIRGFDLRYINQETVMAGVDYGISGYPSFNSPDAMAAAIDNVGFNLVNFCTNHTYDMGLFGVERSHEVWAQYPQMLIGGSYLSKGERETVHLIERNGMTFAFLAYTYGDNNYGYGTNNMPNAYYSCQFDKELMTADIRRAQVVADAVIVSMHWGDEYTSVVSDFQYEYAQFLADLGVDLVLGSHAHIVQPVKYVVGAGGKRVPVVFGLSDIVSGWTLTDTIFSGIFACDFVWDPAGGGGVLVENLVWYPCIEWSDGGDVYVRMLKDMDAETTNSNVRTDDVGDDYTYLRNMIDSMGMEIEVVM